MKNKDFIKIIKEEINNFDFLNNDEYRKKQDINDLLMNEELQKQFICDSLLNRNNKIKINKIKDSFITGDWDEKDFNENGKLSLEYSIDMAYFYDSTKEPLIFDLYFHSDDIDVNVNGWNDAGNFGGGVEPRGEAWFDRFDWGDIDVTLINADGEDLDFKAFKNAPAKIQTLFIREYLQNFIETQTLTLKTPELKDNIRNIPYC